MSYFQAEGLSSSGIKELLKSPAHYQYWLKNQYSDKAALRVGSALHSYVLDDCHNVAVFSETKTTGTKAWDRFLLDHPGKIVITEEEHRMCAGMADALLGNPSVARLIKGCTREIEVYSQMGLPSREVIPVKAKLDLIHPKYVIDLKTTGDSAKSFFYSAKKYRYDIQAAWYQTLSLQTDIASSDRPLGLKPFYFIVVEKAAPHGVMMYEIDQAKINEAWQECLKAAELYAACRKSNVWPGYSSEIQTLTWKNYEL